VTVNLLARTEVEAPRAAYAFTKIPWQYPAETAPYQHLDFEIQANGENWDAFNLGGAVEFNRKS
jgi:hypothetical protein